jgi:hypothetical protein
LQEVIDVAAIVNALRALHGPLPNVLPVAEVSAAAVMH